MGSSRRGRILMIVGSLAITAVVTWLLYLAFSDSTNLGRYPQTTAVPTGSHNDQIWDVYLVIFILAGVVFAGIMAVTLSFSLLYRERPGQTARQFHGNSRLEVVWTLLPVLIVVAMAVPTFSTLNAQRKEAPADALQVNVIGHQWWFEFQYPELGLKTANELYLPVNRPVSFTLQSIDVIHSFWIPQLAGKMDMVPGHHNPLWFTPYEVRDEPYLGQCAEFCGISHANMRFRVFVRSQADFDTWVRVTTAERAAPTTDVMKAGEQQFLQSGCVGCHTVRGNPVAQGKVGPELTHIGSRTTLASSIMDNNPENLRKWLSDPQAVKPGTLMPNLRLSQEALDKLVPYIESLK